MFSIQDYPVFLENIKSLDTNIQGKLLSILEERLKGILPKKTFRVDPQINKYDYAFQMDEKLIPFLDIFDEYFYPSSDKLVPENIKEEIYELLLRLNEFYDFYKKIDENTFTNPVQVMIVFQNTGKLLFDMEEHIKEILFNNKKDLVIRTILESIKDVIDNGSFIESTFKNITFDDYMSNIKTIIRCLVFKKYRNDSEKYYEMEQRLEKEMNVIHWYIFANEMKFLNNINRIYYEINSHFKRIGEIYETKFIEKRMVETAEGKMIEEEINLCEVYMNLLEQLECELDESVRAHISENDNEETIHQCFEEQLTIIINKTLFTCDEEKEAVRDHLRIGNSFLLLKNDMKELYQILENYLKIKIN